MKKEDATKTLDEGLARLADAMQNGRSDELKDYLRVMSRFHQYSFGNLMLILMQMTVTQCGTSQGLCFRR